MDIPSAYVKVRGLPADQIDLLYDAIPQSAITGLRRSAIMYSHDEATCRMLDADHHDVSEADIRRLTVLRAYVNGVIS